jgi:hypothetical protein
MKTLLALMCCAFANVQLSSFTTCYVLNGNLQGIRAHFTNCTDGLNTTKLIGKI